MSLMGVMTILNRGGFHIENGRDNHSSDLNWNQSFGNSRPGTTSNDTSIKSHCLWPSRKLHRLLELSRARSVS